MKKECLKCGNCLYYCPVYKELREEGYSPRGRISLIEEKQKSGFDFSLFEKDFLHKCLLCGACEKNCKEEIKLAEIFIKERIENYSQYAPLLKKSFLLFAKEFLKLEEGVNLLRKEIPQGSTRDKEVVFFKGCLTKKLFKRTVKKAKEIIEANGIKVYEENFTCCGFPFLSTGNEKEFLRVKEKNMRIFKKYENAPIITFCPTGKNTLKKYYGLRNVYDVVEYIYRKDLKFKAKTFEDKVFSLHIPCHVENHGEREYLVEFAKKHIPDIFIPEEQRCCGFGGVFAFSYPKLSKKILKRSAENLKVDSGRIVLTNCPGCILQLKRAGKAIHIIELFDD